MYGEPIGPLGALIRNLAYDVIFTRARAVYFCFQLIFEFF